MYLSFYKLGKMPFQISSDPEFLWLGEKHRESLASLEYGILENKGILLLTGDIGTGKTTLINTLVRSLGEEVIIARVPDPGMDKLDFINFISHAFKMEMEFKRQITFLIHFSQFLDDAYADNKKVLLIIDEAQRLNADLLKEIRLLSNIEKPEGKRLNIFLIGQNEFNNILNLDSCKTLRQRITINHSLEPLSMHETGDFIRHRLRIAGAQHDIFSSEAILAVHAFSEGVPRRINIICDNCMMAGFIREAQTITVEIAKSCVEILNLPSYSAIRSTDSTRPKTPDKPENSNETSTEAESLTTPTIPAPVLQEPNYAPAWRTSVYVGLFVTAIFFAVYILQTRSGIKVFPWLQEYGIKVFSDILTLDAVTSNRASETNIDAMPYGKSKLLPGGTFNEDGATPQIPTGKEVEKNQPTLATPAALSLRPEASHWAVEAIKQTISPPPAVSETEGPAIAQKQLTNQRKAESKVVLEAVAQIIAYSGKAAEQSKPDGEEKQKNDLPPEETRLENNRPAGTPPEKNMDATEIIDWVLMKHAK